MYHFTLRKVGLVLTIASFVININADESTAHIGHQEIINLRPYTVTGGLSKGDPDATILPVSSLDGEILNQLRATSLGTTLELIPGIQSTSFGGGASRPIIRGFDGPRIQILQEGLAVADVSADSPDHAVNITADFAEYIDIIRGPATLLYGGSAIGGVINVVGNLFPQLDGTQGASGFIKSQYHTVNRGWNHAVRTEYSGEKWALQVSASAYDFADYDISGYVFSVSKIEEEHEHEHEDEEDEGHDHDSEHEESEILEEGRLGQSFAESKQYSIGFRQQISSQWEWAGSVGALEKDYGVPGHAHEHESGDEHENEEEHDHEHEEEDHDHGAVSIDMEQEHYDFELLGNWDDSLIDGLKLRVHGSDYEHQELEGTEVGTSFDKKLLSARLELLNQTDWGLSGVSGVQKDQVDYVSAGEEALIPNLESESFAIFSAQSFEFESIRLHAGFRWEWAEHTPDEDTESFSSDALSYSVGLGWSLSPASQLDLVVSNSARLPSTSELFANGLHAATQSYEIGRVDLSNEVSKGMDLRYHFEKERWHLVMSAYFNRFENYIYANPTGEENEGFPVYQYEQNDTDFSGIEAEVCFELFEGIDQQLELSLVGDLVKSNVLDSSVILPRIPAKRLGMSLVYKVKKLNLRCDYRHYFEVDEVAVNESATSAYDVVNVTASYLISMGRTDLNLELRIRNLLDEEIRPHTSFLKDLAPQPGKGAELGLRWEF